MSSSSIYDTYELCAIDILEEGGYFEVDDSPIFNQVPELRDFCFHWRKHDKDGDIDIIVTLAGNWMAYRISTNGMNAIAEHENIHMLSESYLPGFRVWHPYRLDPKVWLPKPAPPPTVWQKITSFFDFW